MGASQNRYLPKSLTADEIMGGVGYTRPEFGSPLERSGSALLLMRIMLMAFLLVAGLGGIVRGSDDATLGDSPGEVCVKKFFLYHQYG